MDEQVCYYARITARTLCLCFNYTVVQVTKTHKTDNLEGKSDKVRRNHTHDKLLEQP